MIDHDDGLAYGSTGIQSLCLHYHIIHKELLVSTRYPPGKSNGLPNIQADILILAYHHPRRFLCAFRTRGWISRTGLMVYSKIIAILAG